MRNKDELINSLIEITLKDPQDFLKVKETLTRIGIASRRDKTLYQSCHILHKQGRYFIVHFKELFEMDGKPTDFTESDEGRRNTIVNLLAEWDLVKLVDSARSEEPLTPLNQIKVISFKEKGDWNLVSKYTVGKRK